MFETIKAVIDQIVSSYTQFNGNGIYMLLFFVAILVIHIREQDSNVRMLMCHYPIISLVFICNPIIAYLIISIIHDYVYWRTFWLILIPAVIAYAAIITVYNTSNKTSKIVVMLAIFLLIIISGRFIYTNDNYKVSTNWFKLPEESITVCNAISNDCNDGIKIVVPDELICYIRQYNADIHMVYGRSGSQHSSNQAKTDRLYDLMQLDEVQLDEIQNQMVYYGCNYLVLVKSKPVVGDFNQLGFVFVTSTETYNIYRFNLSSLNEVEIALTTIYDSTATTVNQITIRPLL